MVAVSILLLLSLSAGPRSISALSKIEKSLNSIICNTPSERGSVVSPVNHRKMLLHALVISRLVACLHSSEWSWSEVQHYAYM